MKTIYINLIDGSKKEWLPDEYDFYEVNNGIFIVQNGEQWVGIYPVAQIRSVEVY